MNDENAVLLLCCRSMTVIRQLHPVTVRVEGLQVWTLEPLDCCQWVLLSCLYFMSTLPPGASAPTNI